jgi:hypothetical protein
MSHRMRFVLLIVIGVIAGIGGLALGAKLSSDESGWPNALFYSAVGMVAAPLTAYAWATRRTRRRQVAAGIALALGVLASMGILLETTGEYPPLLNGIRRFPLLFGGWMIIWALWLASALTRLILFEPPHVRHRLSSRRGDRGA